MMFRKILPVIILVILVSTFWTNSYAWEVSAWVGYNSVNMEQLNTILRLDYSLSMSFLSGNYSGTLYPLTGGPTWEFKQNFQLPRTS